MTASHLTAPFRSRPLGPEAAAAAFPLGGIGTGNVSLGARGELRDWEIFNGPGKGNWLPFTFFSLRAAPEGRPVVMRVLESRLRPPHGERPLGYPAWSHLAGLPRFADSRLVGEYPLATVELLDDDVPVAVTLEAFTPLVPLDARASGIPAAVLRYHVENTSDLPVEVTVAGTMPNALGFVGYDEEMVGFPVFEGEGSNAFRDDGAVRGLWFTSSLPPEHLRHGTLALVTRDTQVTSRTAWGPDLSRSLRDFWEDLEADGRLQEPSQTATEPQFWPAPVKVGSLAVHASLAPGERRAFEFVLAWHVPNRPKGWFGFGGLPLAAAAAAETVRNHYATWLQDAWHAARHLLDTLPDAERLTRTFHASLFRSTLPAAVVDAAASNVSVLRSTTCFRLEDGTFAGWEGVFDRVGSCPGTCTHVWNYAQTVAFLFPELERSVRRIELGLETDDAGHMSHRSNRMFGPLMSDVLPSPRLKLAAVDGQLGVVVRLYREWRFSGDDAFLRELWPHAVRALEYAFAVWDTDGDLVLDGEQHTTYDIELHGPNSLAGSLFYAALRAAAEMARYLGQEEQAARYDEAARRGAAAMDALLWNGEYYVQRVDDVEGQPFQYGDGCLSDQVFGQLLAHVVGLGHVLPAEHVRQALSAVYRHNFRPSLRDHVNGQRTLALDDEAGLLLCSWPRGGRPRVPLSYCDEVWTGIEYQVAAHLIYEGLHSEGLTLVDATRARHDGHRRSPWNEVEAGHHYVRSMSSWALLLACSGYGYDARSDTLDFAPALGCELRCFFSTATGWGTVEQDGDGLRLEVAFGSVRLAQLRLRPPAGLWAGPVTASGRELRYDNGNDGTSAIVSFETVTLGPDDLLQVRWVPPPG